MIFCSRKPIRAHILQQAPPSRQANGVQAYLVTLALFFLGWRTGAFSPARVYELFGEILSALNLFSLAFCCFLYVKVSALYIASSNFMWHLATFNLGRRSCGLSVLATCLLSSIRLYACLNRTCFMRQDSIAKKPY